MREPLSLPVHGFVLAGGKSSRMGVDKATLDFCGRPLVEIAVEKLRTFCADVAIAGNRPDLKGFAPVVTETRLDAGPSAGIEAGLHAAKHPWALFLPVDAPLVPASLLRRWAELGLRSAGFEGFHLHAGRDQPAFCMLRRDCVERFSAAIQTGELRLRRLFQLATGGLERAHDVAEVYADEECPDPATIERWFLNVNTPVQLGQAEAIANEDFTSAAEKQTQKERVDAS